MPELPEVHTVITDLKKHLEGSKIAKVTFVGSYQVYPSNNAFQKGVQGQKIKQIFRLAKNIIFKLENGNYIQIHLAMTGRTLIRSPNFKRDKHERVVFTLELKNGKSVELRFCDMRMFGKVRFINEKEFEELQTKYGPEPLDKNLTVERFHKIILSKKTNIKNLLMDQNKLAGMGNAYAIDALWIAKLHPETSTQTISKEQAENLLEACREILNEGIKNRGLTIDSFVDAFGNSGKQQDYFRVYRQENCKDCETEIEFIKLNGRGTFFCPNCQIKNNQNRLV